MRANYNPTTMRAWSRSGILNTNLDSCLNFGKRTDAFFNLEKIDNNLTVIKIEKNRIKRPVQVETPIYRVST